MSQPGYWSQHLHSLNFLSLDKITIIRHIQLLLSFVVDHAKFQKPESLNFVAKLYKYVVFYLWCKQVAKEGIPLPPDRTICPLCTQKRANPSVVTVSGFVFCYACIFKYVSQVRPLFDRSVQMNRFILHIITSLFLMLLQQYNRCPVTLMPATVDQLRRLFHDV